MCTPAVPKPKKAASECLLTSFPEWGGRTQQRRGTRLLAGGGSECQALAPAHCACAGVAPGLGAGWLSHIPGDKP